MRPDIVAAIRSLAPQSGFSTEGGAILAWYGPDPQPTSAEIQAELARLTALWDADEWRRNRQEEYPGIDALIVALWEQTIEGRPASAADLQVLREAVKQKYPKPQ